MSDLICITNRSLCVGDFLLQIEKIAKAHPKAIVLREKDLAPEEYMILAKQVIKICERYGTPCMLHYFTEVAQKIGCRYIHLPLPILRNVSDKDKKCFDVIGASCHSLEDAEEAERLGCNYITIGHIFDTDCKKGVPGRGIHLLQSVCETVKIPVYAIGGIRKENYAVIRRAGAAGACIMSGFMTCGDATEYSKEVTNEV